MEPLLRVEQITKTFIRKGQKDHAAVRDVSFEIMPGECLGIIGESGSGKTTMANIIARLLKEDSGRIVLDGEDITDARGSALKKAWRNMQMVFQTPVESFDPRCTLKEGIGEGLRNLGWSKKETEKEVRSLLEQCGLTAEFAKRYPHEVSGGQCQRAAIARALALKPKLLILDEATSALDVTVQQEILQQLKRLRKELGRELSILFITHDIALVQHFCDRVLVMYRGEIVEEGIPDDIIQCPKNAYTKQLIDSVL